MSSNKLSLVTPPDDILTDSFRILSVGINQEGTALMSSALTRLPSIPDTVLYVWQSNNNLEWLFDKKNKSNLIIFDTNSISPELIGYFSAQVDSYYFGSLRDLSIINNNRIEDVDQFYNILENYIITYEKSIR